jgi:hypothetical protein
MAVAGRFVDVEATALVVGSKGVLCRGGIEEKASNPA